MFVYRVDAGAGERAGGAGDAAGEGGRARGGALHQQGTLTTV